MIKWIELRIVSFLYIYDIIDYDQVLRISFWFNRTPREASFFREEISRRVKYNS